MFDVDFAELTSGRLKGIDSLRSGGVNFFYKDKLFLRPQVISDYNYLKSGNLYRTRDVQSTYSALGRLNILKYSNIRFREELERFGLSGCLCHAYPQQEQVAFF